MSSHQMLLDVTMLLNTNKKKERLAALEKLSDLLNQEQLVKNLHKNTKAKDKSFNWDVMFIKVHNAVLSLVDDSFSKNREMFDKHKQIVQNVITQIVQKSMCQKVILIDSNVIVPCTLAVFESAFRIKCLGSVYLHIFSNFVMSQKKSWCELREEYWCGMKNLCQNHFSNPLLGTQNILLLEILTDTIRHSSKSCQISHNFLDLFDFVNNVFLSHKGSGCNFEIILLRLTNTLCLHLALEFRYKVCEFMESVFDFVIHLYERKKPDKNVLVHHFFMTTINIHNPNGVWESDKSFYACDITKWKSQIRKIYLLCCEEIKLILKKHEEQIEVDFLNLFVDVSHLVCTNDFDNFSQGSDYDTSYGEPGRDNKRKGSLDISNSNGSFVRSKKIKLDDSFVNLLQNLLSVDEWFWLKYLELLLHKYPLDIKNEYCQIVQILCQIFSEKRGAPSAKVSLRCLCVLLEIENSAPLNLTDANVQLLEETWEKISVELLRSFHKETCLEAHLLLRSLISHSKFHVLGSLIKLYSNEELPLNFENIKTLSVVCQHCIIPEVSVDGNRHKFSQSKRHENIRACLLTWLLQGESRYPCKDLSKILVSLILKRFEEEIENRKTGEEFLITRININDFCQLITKNYMTIAFKNLKFGEEVKSTENNFEVRLDFGMKNKLFHLLDLRWKHLNNALNDEELQYEAQLKVLQDGLWFCELLCHLLSHFEVMGAAEHCVDVAKQLESLLYLCTSKGFKLIQVKFFDLTSFSNVYEANIHQSVQNSIRQPNVTNLNFLKCLFKIFEESDGDLSEEFDNRNDTDSITSCSRFSQLIKNPQSMLHVQNLTKNEQKAVIAAEVLCQYITIPNSSDCNRYQATLAAKLVETLKIKACSSSDSNFYSQLVLRIVFYFTKFRRITVPVLNSSLELIASILNNKCIDLELSIVILQILKEMTSLIHQTGDTDTRTKFMDLINGFRVLVAKRKCGIKTVCKFIDLLSELSKTDPGGTWTVLKKKDVKYVAFEGIITFLKHPYHEVRLAAAQTVGLLFVHHRHLGESLIIWQEKMLKKLFDVLRNNDDHHLKDNEYVVDYFTSMNSSISLISLASIICLSCYWRKKALFCLIRLSFLKHFKQSEVEDIVKLICKELKINEIVDYVSSSFFYLFIKWAGKGHQIEDFPFYLLGYETVDEFIKNHFPVFVAVYSQMGHYEVIHTVASKLNKTISQIVKDCFPTLMAHILPNLSENALGDDASRAQKLKRFIDHELSTKTSVQCLMENLDKVIYNLMRNLHHPNYLRSLCCFTGNDKDDIGPLSFTPTQVTETLENLSTNEGTSLLGKIALQAPSVIQKILLNLFADIENAVVYEDKVFAFYKYIFFFELISKEVSKGASYRGINTFIIRDVVYSVAAIARKDEGGLLSDMGCKCFEKLFSYYMKEFSSLLGDFLPVITSTLVFLNQKAVDTLDLLICGNYSKLEPSIMFLDPFPSEKVFNRVNEHVQSRQKDGKNLKCIVEHFIKAGNKKNSGCRIEGLKYLHKALSDRKEELKELYENLHLMRGFSEDCRESLLHQLICMLVELCSHRNIAVRVEASNCLGELGPSDLTTLVLRPENKFSDFEEAGSVINKLFQASLNVLSDMLVSDNYEIKKASSKALYSTLSTRQGREIVQNGSLKNIDYLAPFISTSCSNLQIKIRKDIFVNRLSKPELWRPESHESWIVGLVKAILESLNDSCEVLTSFSELAQVDWHFAENIFPFLLYLILTLNCKDCNEIVNKSVSLFFDENFDYKNTLPTAVNKTSVQCMVNAVDFIRIQRNREGVYENSILNVNYLHIAKAALHCSAFFTSIFYAELWFEEKRKKHYPQSNDYIYDIFPEEGFALTEILRDCHSRIGNSDGIHGCGYMHILNVNAEIQHFEHLKNWNLSMLHHDIQLSLGNKSSEIGLINSLERSGMFYTLNSLIKNNNNFGDTTSTQYKCASKLCDWSILDSTYKTRRNQSMDNFEKCQYFTLKAFHDEDDAAFQNEIQKARKSVLSELSNCSLESSKNLYLPLTELQCLKELEEFAQCIRSPNQTDLQNMFEKWREQDNIKCSEFKLVELILTNRTVMLKDCLERAEDPIIKNHLHLMLCEIYHKLIVAARREKKYDTAIRTLNYLSSLNPVQEGIRGKLKIEKSRIFWQMGEKEIGKFLLNYFLRNEIPPGELKAKGLWIYGNWMADTKSENPKEIIEYYVKSIGFSNGSKNTIDTYASLAKFADNHYQQLNEYLSSPMFEIKQNIINTQQDLASELRQELGWNQNREKRMAYLIATRQSAIDENEIKNCKLERDSYLDLALKYYMLTLKEGEKFNLLVFRVISLWLSNSNNPDVVRQLQKTLEHIPTYKFLCLLPQLVPRMADVSLISNLIERILQDHPHHTLPLLFALNNSYEDLKYNGVKSAPATTRVLAARNILEKYQKNPTLKGFIAEMRNFSTALIELANYNPPDKGRSGLAVNFPEHLKIRSISKLNFVLVPSLQIPYDKNCTYDNIIGIHKFEESYYLVGGVNVPKRIKCIGTDGIGRSLLVKGKDDLRQDAVMQQVFTIMNSLLYQNPETNRRKLVIRTYKVVPLSQRSGVIEWCDNTQPLSFYLIGPDGKSGAHKKFYPGDIVAHECRRMVQQIFAQPQVTNEDKLRVFLDICKNFHPVFHYFFIEKFPAAGVWFERRLAYIHSVATSSMIGYILGIGDRHCNNILIDNATAEVIHIDLGIAFEQGKTLPTPETVPFRLTRDIVDGMGSSGIEGDFRRSCVKTMEVLRDYQDTILTLLEVLLYDPLYAWTITPEKAYSIQGHTDTSSTATEKSSPDLETNKIAERALIRLKQKLQGTEMGCVTTNVEGQVNCLLQQARDPNNLCRLYHGWQAYI